LDLVWNDLHGYTVGILAALASDLAMLNFRFGHDQNDKEKKN
jgi:hypothetical protein